MQAGWPTSRVAVPEQGSFSLRNRDRRPWGTELGPLHLSSQMGGRGLWWAWPWWAWRGPTPAWGHLQVALALEVAFPGPPAHSPKALQPLQAGARQGPLVRLVPQFPRSTLARPGETELPCNARWAGVRASGNSWSQFSLRGQGHIPGSLRAAGMRRGRREVTAVGAGGADLGLPSCHSRDGTRPLQLGRWEPRAPGGRRSVGLSPFVLCPCAGAKIPCGLV